MTRNDLHTRGKLLDQLPNVLDEAFDVSSAVEVDEGKPSSKKDISHVDDLRLSEEQDDIAIGMTMRVVDRLDLLPVEVNR